MGFQGNRGRVTLLTMRRIDSTHSTWLFDTERMRFCRLPRGVDPSSITLESEWQAYFGLEIEAAGAFTVALERRPHAAAAGVARGAGADEGARAPARRLRLTSDRGGTSFLLRPEHAYDLGVITSDAILDGLNPVQREAASAPDGPIVVIAGAGSGKTRVLTHRIAFLIAEKRASPFGLAAITFTNKAAGEMKARVGELVGPVAERMWVSTFHSMCSRILRREAPLLGYRSSFSIYDQADAVRLVDYVRRDLDMDPKRFPPRRLQAAISAMKNELVSWEQAVDRAFTPPEKRVADVYREYQRRLLEASAARLRRPPRADRAPVPRPRRRQAAVERAVPPRAGRRVPGHQRRAVGARADAHRGAPQRDGGGGSGSVPRRGHADHDGRRLDARDRGRAASATR